MRVSIFGLGYVGCVSLGCLAKNGFKVIGVDVNQDKVNQINQGIATIVEKDIDAIIENGVKSGLVSATIDSKEAVLNSDTSIICVGTPSTEKGHLNLDYIFKVAENIGKAIKEKQEYHVVAVRSTILPGTCEKVGRIIESVSGKKEGKDFDIVDNPEFLREGSAVHDYFNPPLTLIGGGSEKALDMVGKLYASLSAPLVRVDTRTAEIMKYINNTFHALKISFANEVGNICSELNIDSKQVMDILCMDTQLNISPYYMKPGFAYGGSCLPKDLGGLQTLAHDLYLDVPLIDSINRTNEIQVQRAIKKLSKYFGKRILFLGISFKAGTDDLRNSPNVEVVESLLGRGFDIGIYDKNINLARLTGKNLDFINRKIPHLTELMLDGDLKDEIDTADVIVLCNKESYFVSAIEKCENKVILDMVGIADRIKDSNQYMGINW
ncbi:MAG: nucleotide sugar dehydrogenase [Flavobacteriales bacterium]|nr:nucleotide sugar dehydrogenase [Flavobacteriales bacterium]